MSECNEPRRARAQLLAEELLRSSPRLAKRRASHRLGVVDGEDECLRGAELACTQERRAVAVLEERGLRSRGRERGDSHERERRQIDMSDLYGRARKRARRKRER